MIKAKMLANSIPNTKVIDNNKDELIRLNKYIAECGLCSRREADKLIEDNHIIVNGQVAITGLKVSDHDIIQYHNQVLKRKTNLVYILLNKPVGITCTTDINEEDNLTTYMNYPQRIFMVGRLDRDSQGLLLLTNDGDVVNKILRAENAHEKEYLVRVNQKISDTFITNMSNGVPILKTITKKTLVTKVDDYHFKIILIEGMNRQIRRMAQYFDYKVIKLERIRIMNLKNDDLPVGYWRYLSDLEIIELNNVLNP
ncbi:MAG: pseudouridine synthase [Bacilli bacterium]